RRRGAPRGRRRHDDAAVPRTYTSRRGPADGERPGAPAAGHTPGDGRIGANVGRTRLDRAHPRPIRPPATAIDLDRARTAALRTGADTRAGSDRAAPGAARCPRDRGGTGRIAGAAARDRRG